MLAKDVRGSLVHVRRRGDGECVGCIEAGLYEVVRELIVEELKTAVQGGRRGGIE